MASSARMRQTSPLIPVVRKPSITFSLDYFSGHGSSSCSKLQHSDSSGSSSTPSTSCCDEGSLSTSSSSLFKDHCSAHTLATADETDSDDVYGPGDRTVRFAVTVKKNKIKSHKTYSSKERKACWYTTSEKEKMTHKMDKVVARIDAGKAEKRNRPFRGLDGWTEKGSIELEFRIERVVNAVMDEQDSQWMTNVNDEMRIAAISQNVTADSVERALHLAFLDEQEAIAIHERAGYSDHDTMYASTTDDDESTVCSMASLVAKKKRDRERRRADKQAAIAEKRKRRRRRCDALPSAEEQQLQDKENKAPVKKIKVVTRATQNKKKVSKKPTKKATATTTTTTTPANKETTTSIKSNKAPKVVRTKKSHHKGHGKKKHSSRRAGGDPPGTKSNC